MSSALSVLAAALLLADDAKRPEAAAVDEARVARLTEANLAFGKHSMRMLHAMIGALDPADCTSGIRALEGFHKARADDDKLHAAMVALTKKSTPAEVKMATARAEADQELERMMAEPATWGARLKAFNDACPAEAKALRAAMNEYSSR